MFSGWQLLLVWSSFFVGVVLADQFVVISRFYAVGLIGVFVAALVWRTGRAWALVVSLCILFLLIGAARMEMAENNFANSELFDQLDQRVEIAGQVVREPDKRESFTQLYVQTGDDLVLVRTDRFGDVEYGDVVSVPGKLTRPEVFVTDTGRLFNYPTYLRARGVQYVVSFAQVAVMGQEEVNPVVYFLYQAKQRFADSVESVLPPPQSDLGLGLLLGIKQALGEDLEDAFRRTGLIHIVVLSGYNVMLVIAFFWWGTSWFLPLRGRVLFSLVGIVLFAIMVGLSATVVRASIMAGILLLAKYAGARYDVLRALLLAGFVMVLFNPYLLLYDLGFQLSFMATLGLVLFLPQFEGTVATDTNKISLRDIFLATCVTQLFVLPLLIFHIGEVSVVSVLVNVLVLPVVAVAMGLTFVAGLLALVSSVLALPVAFLANLVLSYIVVVVTWFDKLSFAAVSLPPISVWQMMLLYGLIGVGWWVWSKDGRLKETEQLSDWEIVEVEDENQGGVDFSAEKSTPPQPPVFFR